jgi:hypothetical protein
MRGSPGTCSEFRSFAFSTCVNFMDLFSHAAGMN